MLNTNWVGSNFGLSKLLSVRIPIVLVVLSAAYYYRFLLLHALNLPLQDDIYDVLQFITNIVKAEDWQSKIQFFLQQHNDHRTGASRLIYYVAYLIQGEVDFRELTFIANLALPLTLALLFLSLRDQKERYLLLLPSALILFQLRCYGITLWSMAAFAYFYVFLYGFACIYTLHQVTWRKFFIAAMLATLANFTLASGQMIWVLGLASLLQQALFTKSASLRYVLCWVIVAIPVLCFWNIGLETPLLPGKIVSNVVSAPIHHLHYFLALLGSAASESSTAIATTVGGVALACLFVISIKFSKSEDIRLELCAWYIVFSVVAMVLGRAYFTDVAYALTSRYSYPSVLLLCTLWLLVAFRLKLRNTVLLYAIVLVTFVYSLTSYQIYAELLQPHIEIRVKRFNNGNFPVWASPKGETKAIVKEAVALGIYHPPTRPMLQPVSYSRE